MVDEAQTSPQQTSDNPALGVSILAQYTKDLSFENPKILKNLSEKKGAPEMNINIQVQANQAGEKVFEVELLVTAEGKVEGETSFVVELTYAGLFGVPTEDKDVLKPFLLIECPRLLFPFARNIVADVTRDGGMPPLMLTPVDFSELYRQQNEAPQDQAVN